jgi:hypothetical protein
MAIKADISKAKEKAAEEAARAAAFGNFGPMPFYKPKSGANKLRFMPPWTDEGSNAFQWWREVWTHWGVGPDDDSKKNVACPKKTPPVGGECPICDECERLRATGDPADLEMAKQLRAKMRVYTNVIDLNDPIWTQDDIDEMMGAGIEEDKLPEVDAPKIQVYGFGSMIFKDLLDYYTDEIDMTDLDEGYDVILTKEGKDINTKYRLRLAKEATKAPVPDDDPALHNLDVIQQLKTAAEIQAILEGVDPEEAKELEAKQKKASAKKQAEAKKLAAAQKAQEEAEEAEEEDEEPEEEVEEEAQEEAQEASGGNGESTNWPPLDADGYLDFDALTDEQIEDPTNFAIEDSVGTKVHIACFGGARQRDEDDADCQGCPLTERCEARIQALDSAKKKKPPGKKAAKKAPGKKGKAAKAAPSDADSLEDEMRGAVGKRK